MSFSARAVALVMLAWVALAGVATADDWIVDRLRGEVLVQSGGSWRNLSRGDIVSDSSAIRSLDGSRVTFLRGVERIELSGATEIRIFDRVGEKMTTIMQAYGEVTVEAERRNIQHFSVQTPYLAAIVKGTRFTVVSNNGQSSVEVSRGLVQVQDYVHDRATDILPGQTAVVAEEVALQVTGGGAKAPVVTLEGVLVPERGAEEAGRGNGNIDIGVVGRGNSENAATARNGNAAHGRPGNADNAANNRTDASDRPGNSGNTPAAERGNGRSGNDGDAPGNSGNTPAARNGGDAPGNSGNTPAAGNSGHGAASNNGNDSGGPGNSGNTPAAENGRGGKGRGGGG